MADLTIKDVRVKFPQYNDLDDNQLADALHQKFYSDMDRTQFNAKIGLAPTAPPAGPDEFATQAQSLDFPSPPPPKADPRTTPALQPPPAAGVLPDMPEATIPAPAAMPPVDPLTVAMSPALRPAPAAPQSNDPLLAELMRQQAAAPAALRPQIDARIAEVTGQMAQEAMPAPAAPTIANEGNGIDLSRMGQAFKQGEAAAISRGQEFSRDTASALEGGFLGRAQDAARNALGLPVEQSAAERAEAMRNAPLNPMGEAAKKTLADMEAQGFAVKDWRDVRGLGSAIQFVGENLGASLPAMGAQIASGVLAPITQITLLGAEANEELKERTDISEANRVALSVGAGSVMAAFETVGLGVIFKGLGAGRVASEAASGSLASLLASRGVPGAAARIIQSGVAEGSTEAIQEGVVMAATAMAGGEYDDGEVRKRLTDAFIAGGAVGAPLRAGAEVATAGRGQEEPPREMQPPVPQAPPTPPAPQAPPQAPRQAPDAPAQPDPLVSAMQPQGPAPDLAATMMPDQPPQAPQNPAPPPPEAGVTQGDAVAQPDGGRFEIMDETETVDGESVPTGRRVRIDLDSGEVSPVDQGTDQREAVQSQPQGAPAVGSVDAPVAGGAAQPPMPDAFPDLNFEATGGQFGQKRTYPGYVITQTESGKYAATREGKTTPVAQSGTLDGLKRLMPQYSNPYTGERFTYDQGADATATPTPAPEAGQGEAAGQVQGQPERVFLDNEQMRSIQTDASTFQYKGGGDQDGVTDRLQGLTSFDPVRAGQSILFRRADGSLVVADGHQRVGLARRAAEAGQQDVGGMAATIYDERDGYTPEDVMTIAAVKNIAEGSGTAIDAARILRSRNKTAADLNLPPKSALVRDAEGIAKLSDDAFGMVANGVASERDGAAVGRAVQDQDAQANILALLNRLKPSTASQAEMIARDAAADVQQGTQDDLFGSEAVTESLYLERAKVLDAAIKDLRKDKATFARLLTEGDKISSAGNQLDQDANAKREREDATVLEYLQRQANTKGPISDALTDAAKRLKGGATIADARRAFVENVRRALQGDGGAGLGGSVAGAARPENDGSQSQEAETVTPEPPDQDADTRDENAASGDMFDGLPDAEPQGEAGTYVRRSTPPDDSSFTDRSAELPDRIPVAQLAQEAKRLTLEPGKRDDVEYIMMIDNEGRIIAYGSGYQTGTGIPGAFGLLKNPDERLIVHHNHPSSNGFSPSDLGFALTPGMEGIYAHAHDGSTFYATSTALGRAAWRDGPVHEFDRLSRISKDLNNAFNNLRKKSEKQNDALVNSGFYKAEADLDEGVYRQPGRDRTFALMMAMRDAGLIEIEVTGPAAERFTAEGNPFLFNPELKKLYDNIVRSLKRRAKDADQEGNYDRPADVRRHPGKLEAAPETPGSDRAQGADNRGRDQERQERDQDEAGRSPEVADADFDGALDDMFGGQDGADTQPIEVTQPPEREPKFVPFGQSRPGDMVRDGVWTVARKVPNQTLARALARYLGGNTSLDGKGSTSTAVMLDRKISEQDARAALRLAQEAHDSLKAQLGDSWDLSTPDLRTMAAQAIADRMRDMADTQPIEMTPPPEPDRGDLGGNSAMQVSALKERGFTQKGNTWSQTLDGGLTVNVRDIQGTWLITATDRRGASSGAVPSQTVAEMRNFWRALDKLDTFLAEKIKREPDVVDRFNEAKAKGAEDAKKATGKRPAADIAADMKNILRGLKEESDLFGDTPQPQRSMTQRERAEMEARAKQSKMRTNKPQQDAGPLFGDQDDLFGGLEENAPDTLLDQIDALENVVPGWTSAPGGMLTNPHTRGGIIDKQLANGGQDTGKWFIVFGNGWDTADGFRTRGEAVGEFVAASKYGTNPTKYRQLAPLFVEALDGIDPAAQGRRETFGAMMRPLVDAGLTREDVQALQPYFTRFLDDVESGRINLQGETDAPGPSGDLEQDRGDTDTGDGVGGTDVPASGRPDGRRAGGGRGTADTGGGQRQGGGRVPDGDAAGVGTQGDQGVSGRERDGGQPADDRDGAGGRDRGEQRLPPDDGRAEDTAQNASDSPDLTDRKAAQAKADGAKVIPGDRSNIDKTLPLLLPVQRDDVFKVETRFAKPDGHGMLLTNGTGTGKTYSGGGVIKRFTQQGKDNILILAPSQGILDAWVEMGADMGIPISKLDDTKTAGQGVVATTYANAADNNELATRDWDLVISDESQKLSQNASGEATGALRALRAITNRPDNLRDRAMMLRADDWARMDTMQNNDPAKGKLARELHDDMKAQAEVFAKKPRSKVLFLSATPFAYDKNVDYGAGYLFEYGADGVTESGSRQDGRNLFMVQNFGYRIRYHKLTKPEAAVDTGVFEREFHERLKREGVLSGRSLDIAADYDRKFVRITSVDGEKIDEVLTLISKNSGSKGDGPKWRALSDHVRRNFSYLRRMQLLEAIKAKEAISDIQAHLDLGRKVVVFHDYNKGGGFNPFTGSDLVIPTAEAMEGYKLLRAAMPEVERLNFSGLSAPIKTLTGAFGKRARVYNGTVSQKDRKAAKDDFNRDGSGVDVIIVQSAAGEAGISLHDTTGNHQRALINLGMPVRPTTTLQEEGRIRRVGSVSDAAFRYYTTGTSWERQAFASKIAENSGTVENLALGNEARAIRDAFINAYMDAGDFRPSPEDGKGGRDADRSIATTSPYDQAKTHYFARARNNQRRDRRRGFDFYATPEPLGFKMAQWAKLRTYEKVLEPSAGDGAIARYLPGDADRTLIEPSMDLITQAQLRAPGAKAVQETFEDHHIVNKYDAVVMNPPFGSGGKMAMDHMAKAARHLRPGGRLVALVPTGPAADKQLAKQMVEGEPLAGMKWTAEIKLPSVTFEKAGTSVSARIVIFDNVPNEDGSYAGHRVINMSGAQSIGDFFDRLEDIDVPERPAVTERAVEVESVVEPSPVAGATFDTFEFTNTKTGAEMFGVQIKEKLGDRFKEVAAQAKFYDGYYSRYQNKAAGAQRGFLFPDAEKRDGFIDTIQKPWFGLEETAYHGTPHDFDRFSLDAIGTGEGAQTYGWGLYFTDRRQIADHYRRQGVRQHATITVDGKPYRAGNAMMREKNAEQRAVVMAYGALEDGQSMSVAVLKARNAMKAAERGDLTSFQKEGGWGDVNVLKDVVRILEGWKDADVKLFPGRIYTVDIPSPDSLMTWESPLEKQSQKVQDAVAQIPGAPDRSQWGVFTGEDLYQQLLIDEMGDAAFMGLSGERRAARARAQKPVSEMLRSYGIAGHRFLDQGSRSAGEGTYNYVIYDAEAVRVIEKERRGEATADAIRPAMPSLRAELDRLGLKRVKLGEDMGGDRQGAFTADGTGAMEILIGPSLGDMATLYHESIHAMKHMDLFTPAEWKALEIKAAREWVEKYDIATRYPDLLPSEQIEEAIAEAFAEAATTKTPPKGSIVIRAFNKIARFMKALGNALRGAGFQTAEDVFGRVLAGEIGARDAGNTGFVAAMREARAPAPKRQGPQQKAHAATAMGANGGYAYIPDRRIWEELSASGAGIWQRLAGGRDAAMDWVDKARIRIQDRFLPVMRAQQAVMQATGKPLTEEQNAYLAEETFSGKVGRHLFEIDEDYTKPIIDIMAGDRKKKEAMLDDDYVGTWLYARHAQERNARIASINPNMPDGGSGMTDAEAQMILDDAKASGNIDRLNQIGDLIDKLRERTLKLREDAGLITPQEADLWRNQYKYYVPLKGFADSDHSEAMLDVTGMGRRFNTRGEESKRALGRQSEAFNPLQAARTQAQETAIRAEKNRVGQALYNLAKDHPSPKLWSVKTPKQKRYYNRTTGLVETRVEDPVSLFLDPNEMAVKINGQEHRVMFHDERLARAAGSVGADQMGSITRYVGMFGRYFSSINTMLNPVFTVVNGFRDMITAQITIGHFGGKDAGRIRKAMIKNWPKAWLAAYRGQLNKADSEWAKYYREFEKSGAKVAFWRIEQPEIARGDIMRRVRDVGAGPMRRSLKYLRFSTSENPVLGFVERTNLAVDNAIRLAAYVETRKAGWTEAQSASLSKNMTVNFNRRGEMGAGLNAWYVFANAAIQGTHTLARSMKSKQVRWTVLSITALAVIQDIVNAALSDEDEDGELAYDKIPMWKGQMNSMLMLSAFGGDGSTAATIPLPYGYNLFTFAGMQIGKVARGVKDSDEALRDTALTAFSAFSPISGSTTYSMVMPTILDPVSEMAMNEDWLDRPIRPESPFNDFGPDAYKHYGGVSTASKVIADAANRATGGTIAEPGLIDVSPEYIDHMAGFLTGGMGRFVGQTGDLLAKAVRGEWEDIEQRDIPFAGRVYTTTGDWLDRNRYYEFRTAVREARNAMQTYQEAGMAVPPNVRQLAGLYDANREAESVLRKARAAVRAIEARDDLTAAQKSERRAAIDERTAKVYLGFNKTFLKVAGPQGE